MTENAITLTDAAADLVKRDVSAFKSDGKRYAAYVAEMGVTLETLPAHVALFRDAFKAAHPKSKPADAAAVKAYATKVRNGLKYNLPKVEQDAAAVTDYLAALVKAAEKAAEHGISADEVNRALGGIFNQS